MLNVTLIGSFVILIIYSFFHSLMAGLAYTDTSRDVEAIYREMRKLGVTGGTTTEFTLHATSTGSRQASVTDSRQASIGDSRQASVAGSRQASVTELDNQPHATTNDKSNAALNGAVLPPADLGIYMSSCLYFYCVYVAVATGALLNRFSSWVVQHTP